MGYGVMELEPSMLILLSSYAHTRPGSANSPAMLHASLVMPSIMNIFLAITGNDINASWRLCVIVPIVMHLGSMVFIMLARDLPDGSYGELEAMAMAKKAISPELPELKVKIDKPVVKQAHSWKAHGDGVNAAARAPPQP